MYIGFISDEPLAPMSRDKLKLLTLISYKFLPARTGGEIAHLQFHNHIADYIDNYVIGSSKNNESNYFLKFKLIAKFKNRILTYLQIPYLYAIISTIKKERIDVLMCSHPYLGLSSYCAAKCCGIKLISYSHNIESERFRTLGKWWSPMLFHYEKWVLSVSEITFFVTEEDRRWAIKNYNLDVAKTKVSPFGINIDHKTHKDLQYRKKLQTKYGLQEDLKILYFIGTFPYEPNNQAVNFIIDEINPRLKKTDLKYKILVIGKNLDVETQKKIQVEDSIEYLGFIDDIREILDSADIMLNPMLLGGGIKTKAVEALGHNIKVVSTTNGAFGLDPVACLDLLYISEDNNWGEFVDNILLASKSQSEISQKFYEHYYWGGVTKRVVDDIQTLL